MDITVDTSTFLNPGQMPVLGADQPLYAIAKTLQCTHLDTFIAKDNFVLKMGDMLKTKPKPWLGKFFVDQAGSFASALPMCSRQGDLPLYVVRGT